MFKSQTHPDPPESVFLYLFLSPLVSFFQTNVYNFGFRCAIDQYGDRHKTFSCWVFFFLQPFNVRSAYPFRHQFLHTMTMNIPNALNKIFKQKFICYFIFASQCIIHLTFIITHTFSFKMANRQIIYVLINFYLSFFLVMMTVN